MAYTPVPADALDALLAHLRSGGTAVVRTHLRVILLNRATLLRFDRLGLWLVKTDGAGYRIRSGRGSFATLPGQLEWDNVTAK